LAFFCRCSGILCTVFSLGFSQGFNYHLPDPGESTPIILPALAQNAQWLAQALVLVAARLNEAGPEIRFCHGLAPQVSWSESDKPFFYLKNPQTDVLAAKKGKETHVDRLISPRHDTWGAAIDTWGAAHDHETCLTYG
jgi:hypothetical protein